MMTKAPTVFSTVSYFVVWCL